MAKNYSKDMKSFNSSGKCPKCESKIRSTAVYIKQDTQGFWDGLANVLWVINKAVRCPICSYTWNITDDTVLIEPSNQNNVATRAKASSNAHNANSIDKNIPANPYVQALETVRTEEFIGEDQRLVDNSNSSINVTRKFNIGREWTQIVILEQETKTTINGDLEVGFLLLSRVRANAERVLNTKYVSTSEQKHFYSEEVTIEIPARTRTRVFFRWKQIWQHGIARHSNAHQTIDIPYKIIVGVTFDQMQLDG